MFQAQFNHNGMGGNQQVIQKGVPHSVDVKAAKLAPNSKIITSGAAVKKPVAHLQQSAISKVSGNSQINVSFQGQNSLSQPVGPH